MSPPVATVTTASGGTTSAVTRETLIRDAHRLLDARGIQRSASWVRRVVSRYVRSEVRPPFGDHLGAELDTPRLAHGDSGDRRLLGYRDPTAEAAIRNVMAGRG